MAKIPKTSPLAPASFVSMPTIDGVTLASMACGVKYKDRVDVMVAELAPGTTVAGMLTRSKTASANIIWARKILQNGTARVLVVNAGNANAFNGKAGEDSVHRIVVACGQQWQCKEEQVYPCATGVIGEPLPDNVITDKLEQLKTNLKADAWHDAATAIMTTDTFAKGATRTALIDGTEVKINGIAKGSGMIAPDMATMLAYVFTDAAIEAPVLQQLVAKAVDKSFNSITVDSDTSTSDTALVFATAKAGNEFIADSNDIRLSDFTTKLEEVFLDLAHQIVKDGEGATKFIEVTVTGAASDKAAKTIALSIANSPLVKTAIAGEDANWGRIVMAVGKAGEEARRDAMSVAVGGIFIAKEGQLNPDYVEDKVTSHMKGQNITIAVDVGINKGEATVWTCDLTHDYITINADYRS